MKELHAAHAGRYSESTTLAEAADAEAQAALATMRAELEAVRNVAKEANAALTSRLAAELHSAHREQLEAGRAQALAHKTRASELGAQLSDRSGEAQSELAHAREEAAKVEQVLQAAVASESRARAALTARVAELEEQLELQRSDARSVSNIDVF